MTYAQSEARNCFHLFAPLSMRVFTYFRTNRALMIHANALPKLPLSGVAEPCDGTRGRGGATRDHR
uniref:Uncharacterized protein n=1 Tax=Ralstonia solanacearum TaxID=305 RepID=A0A0S4UBS4_RALSL|nr:protein of unknown function [Ralstonia solanacearum]